MRFSKSFAEILKKRLPTACRVDFLQEDSELVDCLKIANVSPELSDLFREVRDGERMVGLHPEYLMLSFAVRGAKTTIALISGADPLFLRKVSEDWLAAERLAVEREFLLLKEARIDMQTGLLNWSNLCYLLDAYATSRFHLLLVEVPPKRNSLQHVTRHVRKCATALLNFFQYETAPHYLGQSTFALVLQEGPEGPRNDVESALVGYLKREGFHRVHIGSSSLDHGRELSATRDGQHLLDEAWTALRHAAERGPFSFCDYRLLASPRHHPLRPPEKRLVRRLDRLWRHADAFTLVYFAGGKSLARVMLPGPGRGKEVIDGDDLLVFLENVQPFEVIDWVRDCLRKAGDTSGSRLVAGIAGYPCGDFKKPEILFNCRKALLHADFLDEPKAAVFDAVSLNISGDIYYGDGDLAKAVREYKRGLACDERDVNLHNSLGVALAMMGRIAPAMESFGRALVLDEQNFMALYNLGLAEEARGHRQSAYEYFKKALTCCPAREGEDDPADDLQLRLGMLAGDLGYHGEALSHLQPWYRKNGQRHRAGRALFHLGLAYHGEGRNREAMAMLQKALQFNEFDDRAMNLLGKVYFEEKEGDDIALALCRKSVELEPGNLAYRLDLAEVQLRCRLGREARENLYRCLRNRNLKGRAQLLLGQSYAGEGKDARAKMWFDKVQVRETGTLPDSGGDHDAGLPAQASTP